MAAFMSLAKRAGGESCEHSLATCPAVGLVARVSDVGTKLKVFLLVVGLLRSQSQHAT